MTFRLQLRTPNNYAAAGFSAYGTFAGATDGVGAGSGYEPAYFVNAENDNTLGLIGWKAPLGTHLVLEGDGAGNPIPSIMVESKIKLNSVSAPFTSGGFQRWLIHIGTNTVAASKGWLGFAVGQNGVYTVEIGMDNGVKASKVFNAGSTFSNTMNDLAWHKIRIEYYDTGTFNHFDANDIDVYLDDVIQSADSQGNAIGYWDDSVNRAITLGGLDTSYSWHASFGDVLISSDITDQLFEPTDDLTYQIHFESETKHAYVRHPSDPILPTTDPNSGTSNTVVDPSTSTYSQGIRYGVFYLENTGFDGVETIYDCQNSFPQDTYAFDSDFTIYWNLPKDLTTGTTTPGFNLYDSGGSNKLIEAVILGFETPGNFSVSVDGVNYSWDMSTFTGDLTTAELDSGLEIIMRFTQSSGLFRIYKGTTLVSTFTLSSVGTPKIAKFAAFLDAGATGGAFLKEFRIYDVDHAGEIVDSIVDLHGSSNTRIFQNVFNENLNVAHSDAFIFLPTGGVGQVGGWNLDISGNHPTGAEPIYGRSFFSTITGSFNAEYDVSDIPVSGGELDDAAYYFNLTSVLNGDGVTISFANNNLPIITFSEADQKIYFEVSGASQNDEYPATISPGSECVVQYNSTSNQWAFQVDGTLYGISTYDPTTNLPSILRISLDNPASNPGAGFTDFRIYNGWIDANFTPLSVFQYHPTTGTFPSFGANTDPQLDNPIPDQFATEGILFNFTFAANTFSDADLDPLTYTATLSPSGSLPAWLTFTPATRNFNGTPSFSDVGVITIKVTADDLQGGTPAEDEFDLTVLAANSAPSGFVTTYPPEITNSAGISFTQYPTSVGYDEPFSVQVKASGVTKNIQQLDISAIDAESDSVSVDLYYSIDGFSTSGVMTPDPTDIRHDFSSPIAALPSGVTKTFIWDRAADLGSFSGIVDIAAVFDDGGFTHIDYVNSIYSPIIPSFNPSQESAKLTSTFDVDGLHTKSLDASGVTEFYNLSIHNIQTFDLTVSLVSDNSVNDTVLINKEVVIDHPSNPASFTIGGDRGLSHIDNLGSGFIISSSGSGSATYMESASGIISLRYLHLSADTAGSVTINLDGNEVATYSIYTSEPLILSYDFLEMSCSGLIELDLNFTGPADYLLNFGGHNMEQIDERIN